MTHATGDPGSRPSRPSAPVSVPEFGLRSPVVILWVLTGFNLLNYLDRYVLAAVLAKAQEDLQLSNALAGGLMTMFMLGYFVTSPLFGVLADRVARGGRKRLMALGVSVWSAATFASGLSQGAASMIASRVVVGVGEASYATIAPAVIDDLAKPEQKGPWMAAFNVAIPVGSALGFVVGGLVQRAYGWRAAFFVVGGPGLLLALLCLLLVEPSRRAPTTLPVLRSIRELLANATYARAVAGYCAYTFAIGGFAVWAPKYLYTRYGMDAGLASARFGLATVAGGLAGTLLGGWLVGVLRRRMRGGDGAPESDAALVRASLAVCALAAGLGAPLAAAAIWAGTSSQFFLMVVPCEIALFMSSGPVNVALLRSVPDGSRASAMAVAIFAIHLFGDMWSPPLIGQVVDVLPAAEGARQWSVAMTMVPAVFAVAAYLWWRASARLTSAVAVR